MREAVVRMIVVVNLDKAYKLGHTDLAARLLARFQQQGEDWQREVDRDPLVKEFFQVHVNSQELSSLCR